MKSRQKNGRDSQTRETEVGEKIAVTITGPLPATDDDTVFERGCNVDPMPVLSSILEIEL